jgi:hypothetical protein
MEKITITINTVNSAFVDEDGNYEPYELARILRNFADNIETGFRRDSLQDINGNTVGTVEYE